MAEFLFTSESVSEGHPDKVADQVSDGVLDAVLAEDPKARVACETLVSTGLVVISGEITTTAHPNYREIAQDVIRRIGYDNSDIGFDYKSCAVLAAINRQSPDIAQGVDNANDDPLDQGAGDQGLMFGYATNETPSLMPLPIYYAHRVMQRQAEVRKDGRLPWLRPDAKSQVTIRYVDGKPERIDTVVLSTQHAPDMSLEAIREAVIEDIIRQHHGTSLIYYFYQKALESCSEEDQVSEEKFSYEGPLPQTKEAAIIMLADSIEAVVRALSNPVSSRVEALIRRIIKEKLNSGQMDECDLTLKELDRIGDAFVRIMAGIYHARVEYPEKDLRAELERNVAR